MINLKSVLILFAFTIMSFLIVGCEGCSRYGVRNKALEDSRDYSEPTLTIEKESIQKEPVITPAKTIDSNLSLQDLFKKYKSAVFLITTSDGENGKQGTGFFISKDGIGISNFHVFEGTNRGLEEIKLESGEKLKIAEVILSNKEDDYIVFKVNSRDEINFFDMAANLPEIGEEVFAIGNPKGLEHTLSKGIVSGYRGENKEVIQTTTEITHGSSGGPLLNMQGEVIGITTAGLGEANLNFAINIDIISNSVELSNENSVNQTNNYKFYSIKKFVDGDTFWIDDGTEKGEKIRFIGVNAPESRKIFNREEEYFGKEAKYYVENLLKGKKVRLEYDAGHYDQFGRTLAYIYLEDGTFLNAKLIKEGYAVVMTVPPNVKYSDLFIKLQIEARENKRGLWE